MKRTNYSKVIGSKFIFSCLYLNYIYILFSLFVFWENLKHYLKLDRKYFVNLSSGNELMIFFFFIFVFISCRLSQLLVSSPPSLSITTHIFVYSTRPYIFSNNIHSLHIWLRSSPISPYFYFTYLLGYIFIISSLNTSKQSYYILFYFPCYIRYS